MMTALKRPEAKLAPTQARARARRRAILDAANSFVLNGQIDKVTTTTIAQRAGIPVGSVYRYFQGRDHILEQLYQSAYSDIEQALIETQANLPQKSGTSKTIQLMLAAFWQTARAHPTFTSLTRWANSHYSLWDVTPGEGSNLTAFIEKTLLDGGVTFAPKRQAAATKTIVTVVSVLVDQSLEEEDENKAKALIDELGYLLNQYLQ